MMPLISAINLTPARDDNLAAALQAGKVHEAMNTKKTAPRLAIRLKSIFQNDSDKLKTARHAPGRICQISVQPRHDAGPRTGQPI
jgi:hypothetical protein